MYTVRILVLLITLGATVQTPLAKAPAIDVVTLPSKGSPLVSVRLVFGVGSAQDPKGKEGLAALTGMMIGSAGTAKHPYKALLDALYPMAASIDASSDREVTVISGTVHKDTLAAYTALLTEAVLEPGFAESDLERNRQLLVAHLTSTLRSGSDERLGLEAIQGAIFRDHPYGHPTEGTVQGLKSITVADVRGFWRAHYTRSALTLGVAGGYDDAWLDGLKTTLARLPVGKSSAAHVPPAPEPQGRRFTLIEKRTASVGIHLGFPLSITRADADFYPLMLANSFLGEHRTFHGRLMQQLRGLRGLNYGDYSYIEHWANPPGTSHPSPGAVRRRQAFTVWIRPVVPKTAHFALRAALVELDRLHEKGLTQAELDLTREFLTNYSKLWAQSLDRRLGFLMDSRFYGMPYWIDEIERRLKDVTVEQVNAAVKKHLRAGAYEAVIVTDRAAELKAALEADAPSPIQYESTVAADVLEADKAIAARKVAPTSVTIVPVDAMFEK